MDAGAAVQMAYDLRNVGDLYIKDENTDIGNEQNLMVVGYNAPEIRIIKDGRDVNTINAGEQYEVQIIVRNCSNISTPAGKKVRLNWSRVTNYMPWNKAWVSSPYQWLNQYDLVHGGYIGEYVLPGIAAGGLCVASISWTAPDFYNMGYAFVQPFNINSWSCALLARVEDGYLIGGEDYSTYPIYDFVYKNNNVARRDFTVLQEAYPPVLAAIEYNYHSVVPCPVRIQYQSHPNISGQHLTDVARVYLQFDEELTRLWEQTRDISHDYVYFGNGLFLIISHIVSFDNFQVDTNRMYFISAYVQFSIPLQEEASVLPFDINVYYYDNGYQFGGRINYTAVYDNNAYIDVFAHGCRSVLLGDSVIITASSSESDVEYAWYNRRGSKVGIGDELRVAPTITQQYYLVGRSETQNAIGYDSITISVRRGAITSISPNPATIQTLVSYRLSGDVGSAYLSVSNSMGQVVFSANINMSQTSHLIELSNIPAGQYFVRIESQGEPIDVKTLIVN